MTKYRIRAVAQDKYVVEKKGWIFWHNFFWINTWIDRFPEEFSSIESAEIALNSELERLKSIEKHLSQPCKVITHDS